MPELYRQLPKLFEIKHFESQEIAQKAIKLNCLLDKYVKEIKPEECEDASC
jgi:hypothetical protein